LSASMETISLITTKLSASIETTSLIRPKYY
jgi:hypothetical protein